MSRAFTEIEKKRIRISLVRAMSEAIARKGFRKTSIDNVVRAANISKGAFYLFYDSKELLMLDAIRMVQNEARENLLSKLSKVNQAPADVMKQFLQGVFDVFEEYPLMREISKPEVLTELLRGLPEEAIDAEYKSDEVFFGSVFKKLKDLGTIRAVDRKVITGLPRLILALVLNEDMIGKESFSRLKAVLISAVAKELTS